MMTPPRITLMIHDLPQGVEPDLDAEVLAALLRTPPRRSVGTPGDDTTLVFELSGEELASLLSHTRLASRSEQGGG